MEVMEDGNLMDKVHILIQRDMEYYNDQQTVLQETICPAVVGGRLDFPRSASFAAVKLVLWWEEEHVAAYRANSGLLTKAENFDASMEASGGCGGVVKASDPLKFVGLITKSAEEMLEHLHVLTQEALDHADLTVLTGTIGAAALLKNCVWFYIQSMSASKGNYADELQGTYKKYQEMGEALAERLLDLHCRLLSLYVLQDADSLDWESEKPFCESERGSYVIQMWWLYMQGTKEDLWNTVPPKMAQRVFSGMLNESLTILTVRYTQSCPSEARSQLLAVDISNLLLCVAQLLPCICDNAEDFLGFSLGIKHKILRDIHTKCQELLYCLILRGIGLDNLEKVFRSGVECVEIFKSKTSGPTPWAVFALPNMFNEHPNHVLKLSDLETNTAIALELMVLFGQPQPNWALLLTVSAMRKCTLLKMILDLALANYTAEMQRPPIDTSSCEIFLCATDGTCKNLDAVTATFDQIHYYDLVLSATSVVLSVGDCEDFCDVLLHSISRAPNWAQCFDRRNVWNQIRPPWYEALLDLVKPILPAITKTVVDAVQTGASTYQAMLIILACFSQLWDCIDNSLAKISQLIQDILPGNIIPLNHSPLIQILISALYTDLLRQSEQQKTKFVKFRDEATSSSSSSSKNRKQETSGGTSVEELALSIAESLCSIDEDNKHTDQLEEFLEQVRDNLRTSDYVQEEGASRVEGIGQVSEVLVSDILMTTHGKKCLKTLYDFMKHNSEWIYQNLNVSDVKDEVNPNKVRSSPTSLLHTMFHIGYRSFDQLLTGEWRPNWVGLFKTPMGLSVDRVWSQISLRWDFRDVNSSSLTARDVQIINNITSLLKVT